MCLALFFVAKTTQFIVEICELENSPHRLSSRAGQLHQRRGTREMSKTLLKFMVMVAKYCSRPKLNIEIFAMETHHKTCRLSQFDGLDKLIKNVNGQRNI